METVMEKTAEFFLGTPYVAHTLEMTAVRLLSSICAKWIVLLLWRMCLLYRWLQVRWAFVRQVHGRIAQMRYRNGNIDDYAHVALYIRLDYENESVEWWKHQCVFGRRKGTKRINFMSTHRDAYRQLKTMTLCGGKLKQWKMASITGRVYYLPKQEIEKAAPLIPHMSMIAFTTSIEGLDTSHVALLTAWR